MAVEDPGTLQVICDNCEEETDMETTAYCGDPETFGVSRETIEENGWKMDNGQIICPKCSEEEK